MSLAKNKNPMTALRFTQLLSCLRPSRVQSAAAMTFTASIEITVTSGERTECQKQDSRNTSALRTGRERRNESVSYIIVAVVSSTGIPTLLRYHASNHLATAGDCPFEFASDRNLAETVNLGAAAGFPGKTMNSKHDADRNSGSRNCYLAVLVDALEAEVTNSPYDGESQFLDGSAACVCTNGARLICERAGRGRVYGYYDSDNPGTVCGEFAGGHDFALIEDRYIVDYWIKWVACLADRAVYDLQRDRVEIVRLYGERSLWSLVSRPVLGPHND